MKLEEKIIKARDLAESAFTQIGTEVQDRDRFYIEFFRQLISDAIDEVTPEEAQPGTKNYFDVKQGISVAIDEIQQNKKDLLNDN